MSDTCVESDGEAEPEGVGSMAPLVAPEATYEDLRTDRDIVVAPGEGNKAVGMFRNPNTEALCFPIIYGGDKVPEYKIKGTNRKIHPSTVTKWYFRNKDIRASKDMEFMFYTYGKNQMTAVSSAIWVKLRQGQFQKMGLTAGQVKNQAFQEGLSDRDVAFRHFDNVRGSPGFWEAALKVLFAMLRQLGPLTFYIFLSMAYLWWGHLLKSLAILANDLDPEWGAVAVADKTDQELVALPYSTKAKLINENPIASTVYFST